MNQPIELFHCKGEFKAKMCPHLTTQPLLKVLKNAVQPAQIREPGSNGTQSWSASSWSKAAANGGSIGIRLSHVVVRRTNQNVLERRRWSHDTELLPTFTLQVMEFPVLLTLITEAWPCYLRGLMTIWIPHWILHLGMTGNHRTSLSLFSEPDWFQQSDTFPKNDPSILGDFSPPCPPARASTNVQCGSDTAMPTLTKDWSETFVNIFNGQPQFWTP